MAKISGPLFSLQAHGNLGRGLIQFRDDRGRPHAYKPPRPPTQNQQPPTARQRTQRERFASVRDAWRDLPPSMKRDWQARADALGTGTGWNLYLSEYLGPSKLPPDTPLIANGEPVIDRWGRILYVDRLRHA